VILLIGVILNGVKRYILVREKNIKLFPRWYMFRCEILDELSYTFTFHVNRRDQINAKNKIAGEYMYVLKESFSELVNMYAFSLAANKVAEELEIEGEEGISGLWVYKYRNGSYRNFIPRYFSTLDYLAFMIYELSRGELLPNIKYKEPKKVNFNQIIKALMKSEETDKCLGWLSLDDRKHILLILHKAFYKITEYGQEILKRYRDIITHRYLPGIDEMTISTERDGIKTRVLNTGKLYSISDGQNKWDHYGGPEFRFFDLIEVSKILLDNFYCMLNELSKLDVMKEVINFESSNIT